MKKVLGFIGIAVGIALGVYVGLWLCMIGGIMGLVTAVIAIVQTGVVGYGLIAISLLKIFLAGIAGWLSAVVIIFPSFVLMNSRNK